MNGGVSGGVAGARLTGRAGVIASRRRRADGIPRVIGSRPAWGCVLAAVGGLALVVRARGLHAGLIYPDGYDYLLMARGIAAHLTPTVQLGPGGATFVPSVDAALKPLFPALVALLSSLGAPLRSAADAVAAVAGAATVVLAGALAARLTGSRTAAAVAAAAALVSPALAFWSGFTGPDSLAQALALATALAVAYERATLAGVLGALCASSRPEWLLVFAGLGLAGLCTPSTRAAAGRALTAGAFVLAAVLVAFRPPIAVAQGGVTLALAALAAGVLLQLGAAWAARSSRRAVPVAAVALGSLLALALSGRVPAARSLLGEQWPLLALAAIGIVRECARGRGRAALILLAAAILLGATYAYRNPGSGRYFAELLPLACVAAGFAAAPAAARSERAGLRARAAAWPGLAAAGIVLGVLVAQPAPPIARDTFAGLARRLSAAPAGALVSAAPDAYGYLLPGRPELPLRVGTRGLILLDAAQRLYDPGLSARGEVIARFAAPSGFERPDGTIDAAPDVLVRGVVTALRTG
jgi:hypothetical protein